MNSIAWMLFYARHNTTAVICGYNKYAQEIPEQAWQEAGNSA